MCEASQVVLVIKNPPANSGDLRHSGSIPGWGRSPGGGHGNPLQDSCLENHMDRGAWWATVHGVSKSRARLSNTRTHWKKCCSSFTQLVTWPSWVWLPVPYPAEMRLWLGDMSILTKMFSSLYESYHSLIFVSFSFFEHHLKTKNKQNVKYCIHWGKRKNVRSWNKSSSFLGGFCSVISWWSNLCGWWIQACKVLCYIFPENIRSLST